jgi:sulfoquinovose isomerase
VIATGTLQAELTRLLDFGRRFPTARGSAWLSDDGSPDPTRPTFTYITARMTHVYCLGSLLGRAQDRDLALDGLTALVDGPLRDRRHGGWFASIDADGRVDANKECYTHAFVVLAASSAVAAGLPGARTLLDEALETWLAQFFVPTDGMFLDAWDADFSRPDPYRGVNANMHGVEALLAAADATGDLTLRTKALEISRRVALEFAEPNGWRIPEHFDEAWRPQLEHHRSEPAHPFQPYGATVGHGLEWSRLLLELEAALGDTAPDWLANASVQLFDRAVADGWDVDGAEGFVYTTDWSGRPVVRDRMFWVLGEALAAAATLQQRTGDARYAPLMSEWWRYAERFVLDYRLGSWHHQLDPDNRPTDTVWPGKSDLYHAVQAVLIPRLPLAPTAAWALRAGLLDQPSAP